MKIVIFLVTIFFGKQVGKDEFGNLYFTERLKILNFKQRRWVIYKGSSEPSKIPPNWESWLRGVIDVPFDPIKGYIPNLTGTNKVVEYKPVTNTVNDYQAFKG